jgi:uncharacterized phage protein (TIGR02218 family)
MRTLPASFAQKLDEGVTSIALAWRLTRRDGVQVGVTQHDRDLSFDGTLFVAAHSFVSGDHEKELNLAPDRTALSGALTVGAITQADLALGRWDHAKVEAFWVDWSNPTDFLPMWAGLVAGASWRGSVFELDIVGPQSVLDRDIGRVYARTCDAALGDGRCTVDLGLGGRTVSRVIATVLSDRSIAVVTPSGKAASDFNGGRFSLIAGAAQGWHCDITHIQPHASTWHVSLSRPIPIAPAQGDAVTITMGCDKSFATCKTRFANALNFRGQPTMPGDDVAFGGPSTSGNHGGKR